MSENIVIVKGLYATKIDITQAKANPKTLEEVRNLTETKQDYFEIAPDEGYIKPYFDWDKEIDHKPTEEEKGQEAKKVINDFKNLGFCSDISRGTWAERTGKTTKGTHKISFRAWVPGYKTTKLELNRRVKYFKKKYPTSSLDPNVYTAERKMGLINCKKGKIKPDYKDDTRILNWIDNDEPYKFENTIISIVDDNAKIWEFDDDEHQSTEAQPPSPKSPMDTDSDSDDFCPEDHIELYEKKYPNPIFYGNDGTLFSCDLKGVADCPNCGLIHKSNNYSTWRHDGTIFVKNMSDRCETKPLTTTKQALPPFAFEGLDDIDLPLPKPPSEASYSQLKDFLENERGLAMVEAGLIYVLDRNTFLNNKELRETFQDLYYIEVQEKGDDVVRVKKLVIPKWLTDPKKAKYRKLEFAPEGCPDSVYNLWKGYAIDKVPKNEELIDIEPFKKLLRAITDSKEGEDAYEYMRKWTAFIFKYPHLKTRVAVVIKSLEGVGKNTYFQLIGLITGSDLYNETGSPETDIFKDFTTFLERKKLVVLDEADVFKYHEKICPLITNAKTTIRKKYLHPFDINNYANWGICTNKDTPVKISESDRRYVVYDANNSLKEDRDFFTEWYKKYHYNPKFQRAVYEYLMETEVDEDFNFDKQRPITQAHKDIQRRSMCREMKFILHYITEAWDTTYGSDQMPLGGGRLFQLFESYCGPSNYGEKPNPGSFGSRLRNFLKKHGVFSENGEERKAFHKRKNSFGYVEWVIDREQGYDWLKRKNFIDYTFFEKLPRGVDYWGFPRRGTPEYKTGPYADEDNSKCAYWAERIRETM